MRKSANTYAGVAVSVYAFKKKCLLCTLSKEIHTVSCTQIDSYLFNKDVSEPTAEWLEDEPVLERR